MTTTTYTDARQSFIKYWDEAVSTREPVIIKRRGAEDVALISADELGSIMETAHLFRSPKNAKRLLTALNRAFGDGLPTQSLAELKKELGFEQR